ncbi:hypothetical protein GV791_30305 [Nocardia cyriacigeorgica]|uniref:PPE domain-containing protein n=1 Tax=Nocardia cyriacigeorgica TaxID=135487 RepID=A0A6P1CYE0_9NOCA|nr:hypothetical protein [Nocardia cyriacigeorgica]MBF6423481.1 hypothetical protein [Nocardia cyriacigeorgica]NEW36817.1 hypothetical protein [Nocardia cyriacigeorgica]
MVVPLVVAAVVVGAIAGGAQVGRNYNESQENADIAEGLRNAGAQKWDPDRQIINSEYERLRQEYEGVWAPGNGPKEAFKTWDHKKIYDALNGDGINPPVAEADINAGADGWRRLTEGTTTAIEEFRKAVDTAINDKWSGKTANAAMNGTRAYTDAAKKLPNTFQLVANGIDLIQGYLGQAKMSVAPPVEVSGFDEFVGHIPSNGLLKTNKHRANEAEALAEDVMINVYQPGAVAVDERTPILAKPQSPLDDDDTKPPIVLPPDPPGVKPPGGGVDPGIEEPIEPKPGDNDDTDDTDDQGTDNGTEPESTTPSSTTPSTTAASALDSATPKNLEDPLARSGQPGSTTSGIPGGGFPGGTGGTGGSRGGTGTGGTPGAGRSLPGGGVGQSGGAGGTNAAAARAAGMGRAGMPMGMMPPGGARGKGDDEDEHKTPDYLVQDRTTELLGEQPRVLPPGGVIGA